MPRDWKGPFQRRLQVLASERGRRMAAERWRRDRQRRAALAAMSPIQYPGRIVRRIVVIDNETTVREAVLFDTDSIRDARRKLAAVLRHYCPNAATKPF